MKAQGLYSRAKISAKLKLGHPNGGTKCRWGRLNAGAVADNWRLATRSAVKLVQSQVYHTERPSYLFAARMPWCSASRGFVSNSWLWFCKQRTRLRALHNLQVIYLFRSRERCEVLRRACLCVCRSARVPQDHTSKLHECYCRCQLWQWFGPSLATLQCTSGLRMSSRLPIIGEAKATLIGPILKATHQWAEPGRSLMSIIALFHLAK